MRCPDHVAWRASSSHTSTDSGPTDAATSSKATPSSTNVAEASWNDSCWFLRPCSDCGRLRNKRCWKLQFVPRHSVTPAKQRSCIPKVAKSARAQQGLCAHHAQPDHYRPNKMVFCKIQSSGIQDWGLQLQPRAFIPPSLDRLVSPHH